MTRRPIPKVGVKCYVVYTQAVRLRLRMGRKESLMMRDNRSSKEHILRPKPKPGQRKDLSTLTSKKRPMNIGKVLFKPLDRLSERAVATILPASSKQAALKAGMGSSCLISIDVY